ncbi:unnamed protein product, partial [Closterium sp. NIES-53]
AIYAMYVTEISDEGACYSCVPGDAGVAAAALGAIESAAALGATESSVVGASESAASAEALHTFTLDSGASRCFFRDCTTLTPLAASIPVSLADPTGAQSGDCVESGVRVWSACSVLLVSDNLPPDSPLAPPPRSPLTAASPSMHSRLLVSSLPRSVPSLPRSPALPCLPCVEGRQRVAPHSSKFPPTIAPLQTLHMDVWGPSPVGGTDQERYFLLVFDDYTRYTSVFPLRRKADVSGVLIPWICVTRRQMRDR